MSGEYGEYGASWQLSITYAYHANSVGGRLNSSSLNFSGSED
jgi:hypothetical protein